MLKDLPKASYGFETRAVLIQSTADKTIEDPNLFEIDPNLRLSIRAQVDGLASRLLAHMESILGAEKMTEVEAVATGIHDTCTSLNGVIRVLNAARPDTSPNDRPVIARRSYPVLVRFALDDVLSNSYQASMPRYSRYADWIPDNYLEYTETPLPRVKASDVWKVRGNEMRCPAFVGTGGSQPRLPQQMWNGVTRIYEACGGFEPGGLPK